MDKIKNPETGRYITVGGTTHLSLVMKGVLDRETLDIGKKSVVEGSRQKVALVKVEYFAKSTHWTNISQVASGLHVSVWDLLQYFTTEFEELKICYSRGNYRILFPGREPFIQEVVDDFIKQHSKNNNLNFEYWNQ